MEQVIWKGGEKFEAILSEIEGKAKSATLKLGFLENATYPDGTPVAYIASIQEWGGTAKIPEHTVTTYRSINEKTGEFNKSGRFVKASKSNFAQDHTVKAHTVTVPARPFFRFMIASHSPQWGRDLSKIVIVAKYDSDAALKLLAERIRGQLQQSINEWSTPRNAPATVRKKGFDKPLIESSHMIRSIDYEVK